MNAFLPHCERYRTISTQEKVEFWKRSRKLVVNHRHSIEASVDLRR
jgi:hypothetical protein